MNIWIYWFHTLTSLWVSSPHETNKKVMHLSWEEEWEPFSFLKIISVAAISFHYQIAEFLLFDGDCSSFTSDKSERKSKRKDKAALWNRSYIKIWQFFNIIITKTSQNLQHSLLPFQSFFSVLSLPLTLSYNQWVKYVSQSIENSPAFLLPIRPTKLS